MAKKHSSFVLRLSSFLMMASCTTTTLTMSMLGQSSERIQKMRLKSQVRGCWKFQWPRWLSCPQSTPTSASHGSGSSSRRTATTDRRSAVKLPPRGTYEAYASSNVARYITWFSQNAQDVPAWNHKQFPSLSPPNTFILARRGCGNSHGTHN